MGHLLLELMKINHKETYVQGWAPKSCVLEYHQTPTMHTSKVVWQQRWGRFQAASLVRAIGYRMFLDGNKGSLPSRTLSYRS